MQKISVIIPCYNVETLIDRCMASVAAQTIGIEALEIICIDDASTDDTWGHLQKWEQHFPDNIILIRREINGRQGAARNMGLGLASAEWVAFVDADDWLEPDYFERLYGPVSQYECDVVSCGWKMDQSDVLIYFDESVRREEKEQYITIDTDKIKKQILINKSLSIAAWGKIIHKKLLTDFEIYFPEGVTYEDEYWVPLLHLYAAKIYIIDKPLYHYFFNPHSVIRAQNMDYHLDWITVQMMKWAEYDRRGILQEYSQEMEYDLLSSAVSLLGRIIFQYDKPSFSYVRLLSEFVKKQVPKYKSNIYMNNFSEVQHMFLEILFSCFGREEFQHFVEKIRGFR